MNFRKPLVKMISIMLGQERERERDFCTIDLHPIDKLENASRQSEKNEELL